MHLGSHLMQVQLDASAGAILKASMEKLGIQVLLKKNTKAILGRDKVLGLRFADDSTLEADMVVISAGIQANWGNRGWSWSGMRNGPSWSMIRCVVSTIATYTQSARQVQHRGQTYGLVAPLWEQAKVLADHITGKNPRAAYQRVQNRHEVEGDGRGSRIYGHCRSPISRR